MSSTQPRKGRGYGSIEEWYWPRLRRRASEKTSQRRLSGLTGEVKDKPIQEQEENTGFLDKWCNHICSVEDRFGSRIDNWFKGKGRNGVHGGRESKCRSWGAWGRNKMSPCQVLAHVRHHIVFFKENQTYNKTSFLTKCLWSRVLEFIP